MYGDKAGIKRFGEYQESVIGDLDHAPAGNVIVKVGRKLRSKIFFAGTTPWEKTEHVVLTPEEADELGNRLIEMSKKGDEIRTEFLKDPVHAALWGGEES